MNELADLSARCSPYGGNESPSMSLRLCYVHECVEVDGSEKSDATRAGKRDDWWLADDAVRRLKPEEESPRKGV